MPVFFLTAFNVILNVYLHFCKSFFCGRVAKKESRLKLYRMSLASPIFVYIFYALTNYFFKDICKI